MDKNKIKSFTDKIFGDMAGAMTAGLAYVGTRTGLFKAMADQDWMTVDTVVETSGLQSRYVEEWLKGMTCAGYLDYDADSQSWRLPEEHAFLLASEGTDHFAGGLFHMAPSLLGVAPRVADAFVHGGGVPFEDYGEGGVDALDLINRGNYEHRLVSYWLQKLPDVVTLLETGARALDVGCGAGHVSLALAEAFPRSRFVGVDLDAESIHRANENAASRGLTDRVEFMQCDLGELDSSEQYDFITTCDCVHDFSDPMAMLGAIRSLLKDTGTLFVVEPKAHDQLEDNLNPIATMFYGFSVFHCMTQSLAAGGPGLGTCMGPGQMEALLSETGFTDFRVLDIKSNVNLFYAAGN